MISVRTSTPPRRHRGRRGASAALAVMIAVVGAACGGTSDRQVVADMYAEAADEEGFDVDPACARQVLGAMSDEDVESLRSAGLDGSANLSNEGFGVLTDVANQCVDLDQYIVSVMNDLTADPTLDPEIDLDCVEAGLKEQTSIDQVDRELPTLLIDCKYPA